MSSIETIENELLSQEARDRLAKDEKRWKRMGEGAHLDDWLKYGPGLWDLRRVAMRMANVNEPKGKGYNIAFMQLLKHHGLHTMDKASVSHVMWLTDEYHPERLETLHKIRFGVTDANASDATGELICGMTEGQRSRLNSPISARQRVERELAGDVGGASGHDKRDPNMPDATVRGLKKQVTKLELRAGQAEALVDKYLEHGPVLQNGSIEDIVTILMQFVESPQKVQQVCVAALEGLGFSVTLKQSTGDAKSVKSPRKRSSGELRYKQSGLSKRKFNALSEPEKVEAIRRNNEATHVSPALAG